MPSEDPQPRHSTACQPGKPDPEIACDECGAFGAVAMGDRHLCPDCYAGKGSCCPEFGKDYLWKDNNV